MLQEKEIGKNIRKLRKAAGDSLDVFAKKTGLSKGYLSKLENSDKSPPVSTLIIIAEALKVVTSLEPELASLNAGSLNFALFHIAREFGIEPATPEEARQILGLKGLDKVNY